MPKKTPIAADVMSTKLAAVAPGAGIRLAAEYMLKRKVSALLVLDAASGRRVAERLIRPRAPTAAMKALMRGDDGEDVPT